MFNRYVSVIACVLAKTRGDDEHVVGRTIRAISAVWMLYCDV